MRWAGIFGVVLAGCYAPHVDSGAPCTPDVDNCPSGQSCQTTAAGSFCTAIARADAATDAAADTRIVDAAPGCFGTGIVANVCLAPPPAGTLSFTSATAIDTATVGTGNCNTIIAQPGGGPSLCVIAADSIAIAPAASVRASGPNPLLLIANTTIDISGELHVDSARGIATGAGAQTGCASGDGANGGGGGSSFGTAGANGGRGENTQAGTAAPPTIPTVLRGGCAGGRGGTGDGGGGAGGGGAGGGAVYLIASSISVGADRRLRRGRRGRYCRRQQ
jgi:hypothetical protein